MSEKPFLGTGETTAGRLISIAEHLPRVVEVMRVAGCRLLIVGDMRVELDTTPRELSDKPPKPLTPAEYAEAVRKSPGFQAFERGALPLRNT